VSLPVAPIAVLDQDTGDSVPGARPDELPSRRRPRSGGRTSWRERLEILVFVLPALALMVLFVGWPVVSAARMSLYRWRGFGPMDDFVGLDNYRRVLTDEVFTQAVTHNLLIVVLSIAIQLPLGLGIALLLNRKMRGRGVVRTLIFVPYVVAEVIAGVIWFQLLIPDTGVVDGLLSGAGATPPDQGFLGTPGLAMWAVIAVLTWKYLGLAILLLLAGLQSVPDDVYEAAELDGASWWQTQWRIVVPLLGPTVRTWCFLSMIGSLQLFDMVWVLTGGGPANATTTMATYLITQGTQRGNYGIAGAASVVLFVIGVVMAALYQRLVLRRDTRIER
jgi:raffinose/stachyose/melibiose transport system permease protein